MQPQTDSDYKKIFTELIKKQIVVLGPDITLAKVKNVAGIEVNENGEVTNINGDAQQILQLLINQFVELSGAIVKKTMESILMTYPGMATMATGVINGNISTPSAQVTPVNQPRNNESNQPKVVGANPFSDVIAQPVSQTPTESDNTNQLPKAEMDSINKALSELNSSPVTPPLEKNSTNVQQLEN